MRRLVLLLGAVMLVLAATGATAVPASAPAVVVATFDTGTNPFHPCFRRAGLKHPKQRTPSYPSSSRPLRLTLGETYEESLAASEAALAGIRSRALHHVPGTNLSFFGRAGDFVDDYPHGAQASSQIACEEGYGLAPDAQLVILNWYDDPHPEELVDWVAEQDWIDVVHLNIQDIPVLLPDPRLRKLNASGKLVVIAAGNGVAGLGASYPMELSSYNAPPGSLIAGANDNDGWTTYSNLDPHVVMDGIGTDAAAPYSFDSDSFGGTSSASPRVTGYVARVLADARARFGHTGAGLLTVPRGRPRPAAGPLADGRLTAEELHEVVRKTADPNPHASDFDGGSGTGTPHQPVPQPISLPFSFYPKMGYGEVSEHTLAAAYAVLAGTSPMPDRPDEDRFYAASESLRHATS